MGLIADMCGIAGFTTGQGRDFAARVVDGMTRAIEHRGPDGRTSVLIDAAPKTLALGHLRLAIIDLATGDQPFVSADGRYTLIYNGEIYNYLEIKAELQALGQNFRTTSDTEVLLTAYQVWGAACLPRFRGMFAFAIWDARDRTLFLARDPFGKKPLLYLQHGDDLVFASEFAALACHPAFTGRIDEDALAQYLVFKYVPGSGTLVGGVRQLPPGHHATWANGTLTATRYYAPPLPDANPARRRALDAGTITAFRNELDEAIRLRMRADVPLGAFLSGGIDSSAIVALMAQQSSQPVRTFSIGFHDEAYSELWASRLVAERYKTDHHELKIAPDDFLDKFSDVTWHRGAPLSEMADVPLYYLSHVAAKHVKVVMSGEGSDELLAGYPKHWGDLYAQRYQSIVPAALDGVLLGAPLSVMPYAQRRAAILLRAAQSRSFLGRQAAWFGLMNEDDARKLCPALFEHYKLFVWAEDPGAHVGSLHRSLYFDKTVWLPGTLLERGDRMTMAASIEGRMPFMDIKLTQFVATLADDAFLKGRVGKQILRRAMVGDLPHAILHRPKVGFRAPVHEWLRGRLRDFTRDMLLGSDSHFGRYADRKRLELLIDEHDRKVRNREKELWSILSLEVFLRRLSSSAVPAARPVPQLRAVAAA